MAGADELAAALDSLGADGAVPASGHNPDIARALRAWANEKAAPDILPYETELFDTLQEMVRQQQGSLQESSIRDVYVRGIYALDVDRVQFIIASYLRTRLGKIQRWHMHLVASPTMRARLSAAEDKFLLAFAANRAKHLETTILQHLPEGAQSLVGDADGGADAAAGGGEGGGRGGGAPPDASSVEDSLRAGPALDTFVFVRALRDQDPVAWFQGGSVREGESYLVLYSTIKDELRSEAQPDGLLELR